MMYLQNEGSDHRCLFLAGLLGFYAGHTQKSKHAAVSFKSHSCINFKIISMKFTTIAFLSFLLTAVQSDSIGVFEHHEDIGRPKIAGSARYDKSTKTYTISGSGYNIWFNRDEFQYVYKKLKGDFSVKANFNFLGAEGNGHRKIGWMVRETNDDDAVHISAVEHGDGLTVLQWRTAKGESMKDPEGEIFFPEKKFEVIQLERKGKNVTMKVGHAGSQLQTVGSHEMTDMPDEVLVGIFICSHDSTKLEQAKVSNVYIGKPGK